MESEIAKFYEGRSVFITGATGFLGKAIVEKLLRDAPKVDKIYVFARPSKNVSGADRVKELLSGELFDTVRRTQPNFEEKVVGVEGDLVLEGLGMSNSQTELLRQNVSVILHCAATVNFNEKLPVSLQINVVSTQKLLAFAKTMPKIAAFVHVSTAYAHCDRTRIEEKLYPPVVNPQSLIDLVSSMQDETAIAALTKPLLGKRPNTYTFTKSLAEDVVRTDKENLPVAIVRPSIICGIHDGPLPGWADNLNGPGGLYIAVAHNLVRAMPGNPDAVCDLIPVDFCSNMILAAAWNVATTRPDEVVVYNCTSGNKNPISWGPHSKIVLEAIHTRPPGKPSLIRKPSFTMYPQKTFSMFWEPILHIFPAFVLDFALTATGKKPTVRRLYRKMRSSINAYSFFTSHDWKWDDENVTALISSMNPTDLKVFNCDAATINWTKYLNDYYDGCKKFVRPSSEAKFVGKAEDKVSSPSTFSPTLLLAMFCLLLAFVTVISWSFFGSPSDFLNLHNNTSSATAASTCNGQLGNLLECN